MNQFITGSMCLSTLIEYAEAGHSAFTKSAKDGRIYFNYAEWINEEANKYGQHSSVFLNSTKEMRDKEPKVYFGNGKKMDSQQPVRSSDIPQSTFNNVPVRETRNDNAEPGDDLPF